MGLLKSVEKIQFHFAKKFEKSCDSKEDALQQARLVTMIAMKKFDSDKARFTTFLWRCLHNHFCNAAKANSNRREKLSSEIEASFNNVAELEHDLTMKMLLTQNEYAVYFKLFVAGYSKREVAAQLSKRTGKSLTISLKEVDECSSRIFRKYKFQDKNLKTWISKRPEPVTTNLLDV